LVYTFAFLFGAGASKPLGIPTTNTMASQFLRQSRNGQLINLVRKKTTNPDIETVINVVRAVKNLPKNVGLNLIEDNKVFEKCKEMSALYHEVELTLSQFIRQKCLKPNLKTSIRLYKPLLELNDVAILKIFTTNYDTAIENVCRSEKIHFSDGFRFSEFDNYPTFDSKYLEMHPIQIYKLHGSVDWWSDDTRRTIFRLDLQLDGVEGVRNLMIYPAQKEDVFNYPYNVLQSIFIRTLNEVDELIVIGHKFGDPNITSAIKVALAERTEFKLKIVNPSARKIKKRIFGDHKNVIAISEPFETWLPKNIKQFKEVAEEKIRELEERKREILENKKQFKEEIRQQIINEQQEQERQKQLDGFKVNLSTIKPLDVDFSKLLMDSTKSSNKIISPYERECPSCGHKFQSQGLFAVNICPNCNERFN